MKNKTSYITFLNIANEGWNIVNSGLNSPLKNLKKKVYHCLKSFVSYFKSKEERLFE